MIRITWLKPEERLEAEFQQLAEEGIDASAIQSRWLDLRRWNKDPARLTQDAERLLDECRALVDAETPGDPVAEPSELLEILPQDIAVGSSARPPGSSPQMFPGALLDDRIGGGWLGRLAGCLLGKPMEGVPRDGIHAILQSSGQWPLTDYITAAGVPDEVRTRYPFNRTAQQHSLRETIACMPEDDDSNYTMLSLYICETAGEDFTTDDVATAWLRLLPALRVYTAERVAYQNLLDLLAPPETARYRNPYREWIGAQIRADLWGWVAPGDPRRAAALAWHDARLSHVKNGLYGAMAVAAMVASAFVAGDVEEITAAALDVIPHSSRLAEAIRFAHDTAGRLGDFEQAVDAVYERYGSYHWVHTINNATIVVLALLYARGDYERAIGGAVSGGWDTDCNGATVGSIMGTFLGRRGIPAKWSGPLRDRVRTSMAGFDNSSIEELIRRTVRCVPERYREPPAAR